MSDDGWDSDDGGFAPSSTPVSNPVRSNSQGGGGGFGGGNSGFGGGGRGMGRGRGRGSFGNSSSNGRSESDNAWRGGQSQVGGSFNKPTGSFSSGPSSGSVRIDVANTSLGRIIGKGGSKIRELQEQTGARIDIKKDEENGGNTPVEIAGGDSARCKELIEELLQDNQFGGGGGGQSRGCFNCGDDGHFSRECPKA